MAHIIVTLRVYPEGRQYVSECLELGTASCGDSKQEAFDNILEATQLYLSTLEDDGECEAVLRKKGVQIHSESAVVGPAILCPPSPRQEVRPATFLVSAGCA